MWESIKLGLLLSLILVLVMVPFIVKAVYESELPTVQEACKSHKGVRQFAEGGLLSLPTVTCNDGRVVDARKDE